MKRALYLDVRAEDGRTFRFEFWGYVRYLPEWRAAGLQVGQLAPRFAWPRPWRVRHLLYVHVRAEDRRLFGFNFWGERRSLPEWRSAGLDVGEILNVVPAWFPWPRLWCVLQDLWNFRNPWRSASSSDLPAPVLDLCPSLTYNPPNLRA